MLRYIMSLKKPSLLFLLILQCTLYPGQTDQIFPKIEGWTIESEVLTFNSENLWKYIDGAADQFLDYEFVRLQTCDLKHGNQLVTIEIYEMSSVLNAFGIYTAECPQDVKRINIGGEAVVLPPGQILLFKGAFYVKIYAYEGDINLDNGTALLKSVVAALAGKNGLPEQLKYLPGKNKISNSEGYVLKNFSGLPELSRCIFARYSDPDDSNYRLFCILPSLNESIENVWIRLKKSKWQPVENMDDNALCREVPYKGYIGILKKNDCILGLVYANDRQAIIQKLKIYE
jgi:hypothetical protein